MATRFIHPMKYSGQYNGGYWAGYRFKETLGYTSGKHTGVDYNFGAGADDKGLQISAIADGEIVLAKDLTSKGFGNTVIIKHTLPSGWAKQLGHATLYSRYMHLENLNFASKRKVKIGEKIGTCGKSGTTAYHLHLDIWSARNGLGAHEEYHKDTRLESYEDPYNFIEKYKQEYVDVERIAQLEAQVAGLNTQVKNLQATNNTLNVQVQTLTKQLSDNDKAHAEAVGVLNQKLAEVTKELTAAAEINRIQSEDIEKLNKVIDIKDKEIKRLEALAGEEVTVGRAISVLVEAIKNLLRR
jgi:murein DD-endopeptidase MepM/ murein hydrolase activator NlpD